MIDQNKDLTSYQIDTHSLLTVIEEINYEISDTINLPDNSYYFLLFESAGNYEQITFMGIPVFGDDYDDRIHFEETGSYENFKNYLKRRISEIVKQLSPLMNFSDLSNLK